MFVETFTCHKQRLIVLALRPSIQDFVFRPYDRIAQRGHRVGVMHGEVGYETIG